MVQYYGERTYARFYALETIARVPYFGYLCVLHLYETLGQWRQVILEMKGRAGPNCHLREASLYASPPFLPVSACPCRPFR